MERHLKLLHTSNPLRLDDGTVDRILRGMSPDDAPPAYQGVVAMFAELTAPPTAAELDGEGQAVTTIVRRLNQAAASSPPDRRSRMNRKRRIRMAGAALVGGATLFAGLGAAGALPGAAQSVASNMLDTVGVSTPTPNRHAGTHPDQHGPSGATGNADDVGSTADGGASGKGSSVSGIAHDESTTGVDKGAAVSSAASEGQSQAGQHGQEGEGAPERGDAAPPDDPGSAPVVTPNPGGTTTGDTASDGKSETGTGIADPASGDRSSAGSGNASDGLSRRP
jgi:hypothetical protein